MRGVKKVEPNTYVAFKLHLIYYATTYLTDEMEQENLKMHV